MKYIFVLLALYLVVSNASSSASTFAALKRINASKFGKTLIDTIQIELRTTTGADPRPKIFQLLNEIRDETQAAIEALDANIALVRDNCASTQASLSATIDGLRNQVAADTEETGQLNERLATLNSDKSSREELAASYRDQLQSATDARAANQKLFEDRDRRFRKILSVLEATRDFVTERVETRNNPSFLQKNNVLLEIKEKVNSAEFMKISSGYGKFINFLATKALNRLKQSPDDEAVAGLNQIVSVIGDLVSSVNSDLSANNAANESDKATFEDESARLENAIATTDAEVAALGTEIANVQGRLSELSTAIETNSGLIVTRTDEYNASVDACREADETYADNLAQRNGELQVIGEVIDILTTDLSNLRQFTEDTITNSSIEV